MTRDRIAALAMECKGVTIDWTAPVRETPDRAGDDKALIVRLVDGRHAFLHIDEQGDGVGFGMTIAADVARCEASARMAKRRGEPSTICARLGLGAGSGRSVR